jgi:hypothetical protein
MEAGSRRKAMTDDNNQKEDELILNLDSDAPDDSQDCTNPACPVHGKPAQQIRHSYSLMILPNSPEPGLFGALLHIDFGTFQRIITRDPRWHAPTFADFTSRDEGYKRYKAAQNICTQRGWKIFYTGPCNVG